MRKALVIPLILLLAAPHVVAQQQQQPPSIEIRPEAPPGIGEMVQRLLNWLYWGAWIAVFGAGIYGALQWIMGDSEKGKKFLGGAIIGAVILAALTVLIPALVS
ncbi:MAG: hypothetical protein QW794_08015 [Thermosphaera sp.]